LNFKQTLTLAKSIWSKLNFNKAKSINQYSNNCRRKKIQDFLSTFTHLNCVFQGPNISMKYKLHANFITAKIRQNIKEMYHQS